MQDKLWLSGIKKPPKKISRQDIDFDKASCKTLSITINVKPNLQPLIACQKV